MANFNMWGIFPDQFVSRTLILNVLSKVKFSKLYVLVTLGYIMNNQSSLTLYHKMTIILVSLQPAGALGIVWER